MKQMIKYLLKSILSILFFLCSVQTIFAQEKEAEKQYSLDELLQIAEQNSYTVQAGRLNLEAKEVAKSTAFELPSLEVNAQYGHYDGPDNNLAIEVSQTLPFPSLFWAKSKDIQAKVKQAKWQLEERKNLLRQSVRILVEQIYYTQSCLDQWQSMDSLYTRYLDLMKKKVAVGECGEQEQKLVEVKCAKFKFENIEKEQELIKLYAQLYILTRTSDFKLSDRTEDILPIDMSQFLYDESSNPRANILLGELEELKAEKNIALAEQLPAFTLGYQNQSAVGVHTVGGKDVVYGIGDRLHSFSMGISLPINFVASASKVKSLSLDYQAKELEIEQSKQSIKLDYQLLMKQYELELARYNYYNTEVLLKSKAMTRFAEQSFSLGGASYLEYVTALETINDLNQDYLRSRLNLNLCIINLYALINK